MELLNRNELESRLDQALKNNHAGHAARLSAILSSDPFAQPPAEFWELVQREHEDTLSALLLLIFLMSAGQHGASDDMGMSLGVPWVSRRISKVVPDYINNSKEALRAAQQQWQQQQTILQKELATAGDIPPAAVAEIPARVELDVREVAERVFSPHRARAMAVTETTNAAIAASEQVIRDTVGQTDKDIWWTRRVFRNGRMSIVCPDCKPLHGTPRSVWSKRYPDGPGSGVHPLCACYLGYANEDLGFNESFTEHRDRNRLLEHGAGDQTPHGNWASGTRKPKKATFDKEAREWSDSAWKSIGDSENSAFLKSGEAGIPSENDLREWLKRNQVGVIHKNREIPEGELVQMRIDIPMFNRTTEKLPQGLYAVTFHKNDKSVGTVIGYDSQGRLKGRVVFSGAGLPDEKYKTVSNQKAAANMMRKGKNKFPVAVVTGRITQDRTIPNDINEWTPVGYNPHKAIFFYDKRTGEEVIAGTDAISIGNTVYVRKPEYRATNKRFANNDTRDKIIDPYATPVAEHATAQRAGRVLLEHGEGDQTPHGNWARGGSYEPSAATLSLSENDPNWRDFTADNIMSSMRSQLFDGYYRGTRQELIDKHKVIRQELRVLERERDDVFRQGGGRYGVSDETRIEWDEKVENKKKEVGETVREIDEAKAEHNASVVRAKFAAEKLAEIYTEDDSGAVYSTEMGAQASAFLDEAVPVPPHGEPGVATALRTRSHIQKSAAKLYAMHAAKEMAASMTPENIASGAWETWDDDGNQNPLREQMDQLISRSGIVADAAGEPSSFGRDAFKSALWDEVRIQQFDGKMHPTPEQLDRYPGSRDEADHLGTRVHDVNWAKQFEDWAQTNAGRASGSGGQHMRRYYAEREARYEPERVVKPEIDLTVSREKALKSLQANIAKRGGRKRSAKLGWQKADIKITAESSNGVPLIDGDYDPGFPGVASGELGTMAGSGDKLSEVSGEFKAKDRHDVEHTFTTSLSISNNAAHAIGRVAPVPSGVYEDREALLDHLEVNSPIPLEDMNIASYDFRGPSGYRLSDHNQDKGGQFGSRARKVMRGAVNSLAKSVITAEKNDRPIHALNYTATNSEPSRVALYRNMTSNVPRYLPGYTGVEHGKDDPRRGGDTYFTIIKDELYDALPDDYKMTIKEFRDLDVQSKPQNVMIKLHEADNESADDQEFWDVFFDSIIYGDESDDDDEDTQRGLFDIDERGPLAESYLEHGEGDQGPHGNWARGGSGKAKTETPQWKNWFSWDWKNDKKGTTESAVVDENGAPLVVYHGTARPGRIGEVFDEARATSGPMPMFTDNPEIAGRYSTGKQDTSIVVEDLKDFWTIDGKPMKGRRAWRAIGAEQRALLAKNLPFVVEKDQMEADDEIIQDGQGGFALSKNGGIADKSHWDFIAKRESKGDYIDAAYEIWVNSASLAPNEEEGRLADVLATAGLKSKAVYDDPHAVRSAVFPAHLSITKPLVTTDIPARVVDALETAALSAPAGEEYGADAWDKDTRDPDHWVSELKKDMAKGKNSFVWSSIPDFVTETLKDQGYDGIKDVGGKMGGEGHTVWIPFQSEQVKSATANSGDYDPRDERFTESYLEHGTHDQETHGNWARRRRSVETLMGGQYGEQEFKVYTNPSRETVKALADGFEWGVRGLEHPKTGDLYFWDAGMATHDMVFDDPYMGLDGNDFPNRGSERLGGGAGNSGMGLTSSEIDWVFDNRPEGDETQESWREHGTHDQKTHGNWARYSKAFDRMKAPDGGFTYSPGTGEFVGSGYVVSPFPEHEWKRPNTISDDDLRNGIRDFFTEHYEKFSVDNNIHYGGWHDPDTESYQLDLVMVMEDRNEAERIGEEHAQQAIFNLETFETIEIDPEAAARRRGDIREARQHPHARAGYREGDRRTIRAHDGSQPSGVERLQEHGADHDESSHGNWARGGRVTDEGRAEKTGDYAIDDDVPAAPGTVPIPENHVRFFHYSNVRGGRPEGKTWDEAVHQRAVSLREKGINLSAAKGESYGEPNVVWAASKMPENIGHKIYVEFSIPIDDPRWGGPIGKPFDSWIKEEFATAAIFQASGSDATFEGGIKPEDIIAVHEPWHRHVRYMVGDKYDKGIKHRMLKKVADGEFDFHLDRVDDDSLNDLAAAVRRTKDIAKRAITESWREHEVHDQDDHGNWADGGSKAEPTAKAKPLVKDKERAARAKKAYVESSGEMQDLSREWEKTVGKGLGLQHFGGTSAMDHVSQDGMTGFEVKMTHRSKAKKLTMRKDSVANKREWQAEVPGRVLYTVAWDNRDKFEGGKYKEYYSGHNLYFRSGVGNYSYSTMIKADSLEQIKEMIDL